jgi:hypothetical protein
LSLVVGHFSEMWVSGHLSFVICHSSFVICHLLAWAGFVWRGVCGLWFVVCGGGGGVTVGGKWGFARG